MKLVTVGILLLAMMFIGCGASKDFVIQQIEQSESKTQAEIDAVSDKTDGNASEISKLRDLSTQLAEKTDLAINEAKGFESYQVIWQGEINYDFDSFELTPTAEDVLNEAGQKMEQSPESIIEIAGHTDRSGSSKYNMMLGRHRAGAAKLYLADRFGISLYRLFIVSYGDKKPVATPDEENANSRNRRVVLKVWGKM